MKYANANQLPKRYFGLHFVPGLAEYREGESVERILVNEETMKRMDPSFEGKPVYVRHVNEVDLQNLQTDADGFVVKSFYNEIDGNHWVEFMIVSDEGHRAIARGWKLSNAWIPKNSVVGGTWHGVDFDKQVTDGEFEHLAIVPNPRYKESMILTPEDYKKYCEKKKADLLVLQNSDGEVDSMAFFNKTKVANSDEIMKMEVELPKSKKIKSIATLINEADEKEVKEDAGNVMADPSHMVELHDGTKCNVGDLLEKHKALNEEKEAIEEKYNDLMKEIDGKKDDDANGDDDLDLDDDDDDDDADPADEEAREKALEIAAHEEKEMAGSKHNSKKVLKLVKNAIKAYETAKKSTRESADDKAQRLADNKAKATRLRNAESNVVTQVETKIETSMDQLARGSERYGTANESN